jgi:membrane fusion protein (multidrug efflux system)
MNPASQKLISICFLAVLLISSGCRSKKIEDKEKDSAKSKNRGVPVEVVSLTRGEIENMIKASASLEVERVTPVYARTANLVKAIEVEAGDFVNKGDVLLYLEDDVQQTLLERAKVQHERSKLEYDRNKALFDQGLVSDQVFKEQEFQFREIGLNLVEAQREYDYTRITAPISGMITSRDAKIGFPLNIGSAQTRDGIFQIMDFTTMQAKISLAERYLTLLKKDQPARVLATPFPDTVFEGYVERIAPVVDAATGTITIVIGFKDIGPLLPGMYVDVELVISKKPNALLISKRAIVYDNDSMFVFRLKPRKDESEPRQVERILLEPVMVDKFNLEPQPDIFTDTDQIVITGQTGLKNDAIVRLPGDPEPEPEEDEEDDKKKD